MKYYAIENLYGSETSHGFANTWQVLVFASKKGRDEYVTNSTNLTTEKIKKSELSLYTPYVKPWSGDYLGIEYRCNPEKHYNNLIGFVTVASGYDYPGLERLY